MDLKGIVEKIELRKEKFLDLSGDSRIQDDILDYLCQILADSEFPQLSEINLSFEQ